MSDDVEVVKTQAKLNLPQGQMFLYEQPEILTLEQHGELGINPEASNYGFTRSIISVPLVAAEMASAQKDYPVVFSDIERVAPVAVLSLLPEENMFVGDGGAWDANSYIPSYLRRYPFALAGSANDQYVMVIDRACEAIGPGAEQLFFSEGKLSDSAQQMVDFCGKYEAESRRTLAFSERLKELDLIVAQRVTTNQGDDEEPLATYFAVDGQKLMSLPPDVLHELAQQGYLAFIFAHLFSLENWKRLIDRRAQILAQR